MGDWHRGHRMVRTAGRALALALTIALAAAGCRGDDPSGPGGDGALSPTDGTVPADQPVDAAPLVDVMESDAAYIIGISYPPGIERHPGLAAELKRYAEAARAELMEAVEAREPDAGSAGLPYDLTLAYEVTMDTPEVVAVQAFGTLYTGGAHGNPLVARFVWLPARNAMLRAQDLVPAQAGWDAISAYVREALVTALSQRLDADRVDPADRSKLMGSGSRMIDDGTEPAAANFAQFEPIPGPGGRLGGLRFVFPPYQVGPYSDGLQTVDVPASVLAPHLAPEYRDLFAAG